MKVYQISKTRRIITFDDSAEKNIVNNPETPDSMLLKMACGWERVSEKTALFAKKELAQRIKNEIRR